MLLSRNKYIFAKLDIDTGQTETIKKKLDTNKETLIRTRPYMVPLTKRLSIDKAVDEMFANVTVTYSYHSYSS